MKITFKASKAGILEAYTERFGHVPSPDAMRELGIREIERQASLALEKGEPVPGWQCSNPFGKITVTEIPD